MKRALLIVGGTVGGLGAVLSITPPQLSSTGMTDLSGMTSGMSSNAGTAANTTTTQAATVAVPQVATPAATTPAATPASFAPKATTKKKITAKATTKKTTSSKVASTTATTNNNSGVTATVSTPPVTPTQTQAKITVSIPVSKGVSGTFVGSSVDIGYGVVQVQITVVDGKITDAQALQAPSGRNSRFTQYAIPVLKQQTLAAQSSQIHGASGASYTSWGWYTSLQAALVKAGL
ncbi:MAG: FMN-binding protein [Actinomycetota bacterium]